jgi:hypothetical protein
MYNEIARSGSSASKKSNCAVTSPAISSCTGPCSMMMRSFNKRLKMSKARSPIPLLSMTMGTKGMPRLAVFMRGVARRRAWRISILFIFASVAYART